MRRVTFILALMLTATAFMPMRATGVAEDTPLPLAVSAAKVSLEGTSNVHAFTASTTTMRVTAMEIGGTPAGDLLAHVLTPGGLTRFDVTIPAATLTSPKEDIDKNMHKALKVQQHPEIRFRLRALEAAGSAYRAAGWLTVAGVEKEVTLNVQAERTGTTLAVTGTTDFLMTDYGIAPPRAMLGVLKTNPKVTIRIELTLAAN